MKYGQHDLSPFFDVTHSQVQSGPRVGRLSTEHGICETPCFLPIASHGTLRALGFDQALECGTAIVMANAWYIFRNTSIEALRQSGGAHGQMGWTGILFTDSGGYQVFSLKDDSIITDDGVLFGGDGEVLTPEYVIEMQKHLGSDIMMVLDDCAPYPCDKTRGLEAVRRTTLWAARSMAAHNRLGEHYGRRQHIFGIVQGSTYEELRRQSCEEVAALGFDGFGIGGLSIGMPRSAVREMTYLSCNLLPSDKPRHLLGVGLPGQILEGIADGADTFDCVLPIRKAQRGVAYTRSGVLYYKRPQPPIQRDEPLDSVCNCSTCNVWSQEELRLLFKRDKQKAGTLAAIHNLYFYHQVLAGAREAIRANSFSTYRSDFMSKWNSGEWSKGNEHH
jgi:queuine tRNA-ribosyltransferase